MACRGLLRVSKQRWAHVFTTIAMLSEGETMRSAWVDSIQSEQVRVPAVAKLKRVLLKMVVEDMADGDGRVVAKLLTVCSARWGQMEGG